MRKVLHIAWKDLIITFRDTTALLLMLVAPFALTLVMVFAFGGFTSGGSGGTGLSDIPVVIVNRDAGQFGASLVQVFQSEDLADLMEPAVMDDAEAARAAVDADEAAAAVIVPENLSENMIPTGPAGLDGEEQSLIEVYANPSRPISAGVVRGIVEQFLNDLSAGVAGAQVAITQLIAHDLISAQEAPSLGPEIGQRMAQDMAGAELINVESETVGGESEGFNWLAYMAPSMAILFLMFTVTAGGRTILVERDQGTLPRMLTTPTTAAQVLGGKVSGIYLTGLAQMVILILASALPFDVSWGSPVAVALLLLALVAAATGWGALIAAYSRSTGQASILGTIVALTFGIGSGNFFAREALPHWLQTVSLVSPNAWGLEAFTTLGSGGGLADIGWQLAGLLIMAAVLFGVAVVLFRRQYA